VFLEVSDDRGPSMATRLGCLLSIKQLIRPAYLPHPYSFASIVSSISSAPLGVALGFALEMISLDVLRTSGWLDFDVDRMDQTVSGYTHLNFRPADQHPPIETGLLGMSTSEAALKSFSRPPSLG